MNNGAGTGRLTSATFPVWLLTVRSLLLAVFLVLIGDRPFVPAVSAAPSKRHGVTADCRFRPHEPADSAFGAPVRNLKPDVH
jgi:hypothetical protein